ncbi:MAG: redoxin domain-containing protein [Phycisphaeraceae bacterium]|nr:MAG: redoxin domain-containing protein [Phycisphaeraceae bacterium]
MNAQCRRAIRASFVLALLATTLAQPNAAHAAQPTTPTHQRAVDQYNINKARLAIAGYDPVSYFPEGGSKPAKGDPKLEHIDRGVTYRFASRKNLDLFRSNPDKFIPAHGGWCSWAMAENGSKVEIDPKSFLIVDGRLLLFYKDILNDTRAKFQKNLAPNIARADAAWMRLSGEAPFDANAAPTLQSRLEDTKRRFDAQAPEQMKTTFEDGISSVATSGITQSALNAGARAPDFTLSDHAGNPVRLSDLLKQGPVVLTWYRGGWCPYCNIQLRAYQDALPDITSLGARLVAISPELPDNSLTTREKNALEFTVLSDTGSTVARAYGLSYKVPDAVADAFKGMIDLPSINGDDSWELPLAATYVISPDGTIAYAFLSADYRERAEPQAIIDALRNTK